MGYDKVFNDLNITIILWDFDGFTGWDLLILSNFRSQKLMVYHFMGFDGIQWVFTGI